MPKNSQPRRLFRARLALAPQVAFAALAALVATAAAYPNPQALAESSMVSTNAPLAAGVLVPEAPAATPAPGPSVAPRPIQPPSNSAGSEEKKSIADESRPIAKPTGSFTTDAIRTGLALLGVLVLIFVFRWILRRVGDPLATRRPSGVVQVLSRFPLAKGQSVLLVEVGRRVLCVHQSSTGASTLCEFSDLTEIADLKARIEAGSSDRAAFERQLVRSLEREAPSALRERPATLSAVPRELLLENSETVDLTKRPRRAVAGRIGVVA